MKTVIVYSRNRHKWKLFFSALPLAKKFVQPQERHLVVARTGLRGPTPQLVHVPKPYKNYLGKGLIAIATFALIFFSAPLLAYEMQSTYRSLTKDSTLKQYEAANKPTMLTNLVFEQEQKLEIPHDDKRFQLQIPAIKLDTEVIANVDTTNVPAYEAALKQGVAHAAGSGFPGEQHSYNQTVFIFGHSTDSTLNITQYNALFYDIKILKPGDEIKLWFWGKEFKYLVNRTEVVDANDTTLLEPQTEKEQLILQTCWPPGTTWKRLLVIAEPAPSTPSAILE